MVSETSPQGATVRRCCRRCRWADAFAAERDGRALHRSLRYHLRPITNASAAAGTLSNVEIETTLERQRKRNWNAGLLVAVVLCIAFWIEVILVLVGLFLR